MKLNAPPTTMNKNEKSWKLKTFIKSLKQESLKENGFFIYYFFAIDFILFFLIYFLNFKIFNSYMRSQT